MSARIQSASHVLAAAIAEVDTRRFAGVRKACKAYHKDDHTDWPSRSRMDRARIALKKLAAGRYSPEAEAIVRRDYAKEFAILNA